MMAFYRSTDTSFSLPGKIIIIPIVSVGNVAQLAADLLIENLALEQVGIFDSRDLVPVVGARERGPGLSTPLELYGKNGSEVVVVQQRSPVLKSRKENFSISLLKFIKEHKFAAVLFLTGVDVSNRNDAQMLSPIYSLVSPRSSSIQNTPLSNASQLPQYTFVHSDDRSNNPISSPPKASSPSTSIPIIPGGGLTRRILTLIDRDASGSSNWSSMPTAAILQFVLEGDNRADAAYLANVVAKVLELHVAGAKDGDAWKQPPSWKVGLFGTPHDQTLYG